MQGVRVGHTEQRLRYGRERWTKLHQRGVRGDHRPEQHVRRGGKEQHGGGTHGHRRL